MQSTPDGPQRHTQQGALTQQPALPHAPIEIKPDPAAHLPRSTADLPPELKIDVPPAFAADAWACSQALEACPSCTPDKYFESMYECADGDPSRVPWAECRPNPALVEWLNREACHLVRPGSRAAVAGCGLGDDLAELIRRGYDAIGFDVSPTAVRWAARRHSNYSDRFVQADLLNLPTRMHARFDLVVEISTIHSVHPSLRRLVCAGLARLLAPRGAVMVLARGRADDEELDLHDGPPWPLTRGELLDNLQAVGLCPHGSLTEICDINNSNGEHLGRHWLLGTFVRC